MKYSDLKVRANLLRVKQVETEAERDAAFAIRREVFIKEQGIPPHLERDEFDESSTHFVVYDDEQIVATARVQALPSDIGIVERVCVIKEYRGTGLGALIMKEVEKFARQIELKRLRLTAQSFAVPFYEKLQYEYTSPEFMDAGIPHRVMEKSLK